MSINKEAAWSIFKGEKLAQKEAITALNNLTKGEFEAYECWAEDFELALAKVQVEAQNEAARIWEDNPTLVAELEAIKPYLWTSENYVSLASVFKGAKYEQLHLTAQFRIRNVDLLLELARAAA